MLTKQDHVEINEWFLKRGEHEVDSTIWMQHNNELGRHLYKKLNFFIQACKRDWNKKYKIDLDECESMLYMGMAKAMMFYGTETTKRKTMAQDGNYKFTGKFKCNFSTYLTEVVTGSLHNYLRKMNYKKPIQRESDPLTKKQFAKRFHQGKKRQIPPHLVRSFNQVPRVPNTPSYDVRDEYIEIQIKHKEEMETQLEHKDLLAYIYKKCTPIQRDVLDYLAKGFNQREIADKLNVNSGSIHAIIKRLQNKYKDSHLWQNQ